MFSPENRYQNLSEKDREVINAAYKVYYETFPDNNDLILESSLDKLVEKGIFFIPNAWTRFTYYLTKRKEEGKSLTESLVREAFEAYKLGFQDQNFFPFDIPNFNSCSDKEKNAYLAAAEKIYQELEPQLQRSHCLF